MSKRTRLWTPADLSVSPVSWLDASLGGEKQNGGLIRAMNRANGSCFVAGAQPASSVAPEVSEDETLASKTFLNLGTAGHQGYMVATGTESALEGKTGFSVFAVQRMSDSESFRAVVLSISDASGAELGALSFGTRVPIQPVQTWDTVHFLEPGILQADGHATPNLPRTDMPLLLVQSPASGGVYFLSID